MAVVTLTISAVSSENDIIYEQEYIGSNNA